MSVGRCRAADHGLGEAVLVVPGEGIGAARRLVAGGVVAVSGSVF